MSKLIMSSHLGENVLKSLPSIHEGKRSYVVNTYLSDPDLSAAEMSDLQSILKFEIEDKNNETF